MFRLLNLPSLPVSNQQKRVNRRETARKLLQTEIEQLPPTERAIIERFISRCRIARDIVREFDEQLTWGERLADRVANFGGSWTFILLFLLLLAGWMAFNTYVLRQRAYDPYPFILLNLILSCVAALQAPVIMMSENRLSEQDRMQARNDYKVNVKAELEVTQIHEKLNEMRESDWLALVAMQQEQIALLNRILRTQGGAAGKVAD